MKHAHLNWSLILNIVLRGLSQDDRRLWVVKKVRHGYAWLFRSFAIVGKFLWIDFTRVEWRRKKQGGATVEMGWWRWFVITRTVTTVRRAALKRVGVDQYAAGAVRKLKRVLSVLLGPLLPELSKKDPTSIVRHYWTPYHPTRRLRPDRTGPLRHRAAILLFVKVRFRPCFSCSDHRFLLASSFSNRSVSFCLLPPLSWGHFHLLVCFFSNWGNKIIVAVP